VLPHQRRFLRTQFSGLKEDVVGHGDLADVVEEGPSPDMAHVLLVHPHALRQAHRHLRHALRMALGLVVPKVQCFHPTLQRRVVRQAELRMRAFQLKEHRRAVYRDRRLSGKHLQERKPVLVRVQPFAVEDFNHSDHLPFRQKRNRRVADEALLLDQIAAAELVLPVELQCHHARPLQRRAPRKSLAERHPGCAD
jgi:hypothetical protein